MDWDAIAAIGQIVSALAVAITLVYVAMDFRMLLTVADRARSRAICLVSGLALIGVAAGCASTPKHPTDLLVFLAQPTVSRQDVLAHLGAPSAEFENSHVLTYRLSRCNNGHVVDKPTRDWEGIQCDLVVVLDDRDIVQRHKLIEIR